MDWLNIKNCTIMILIHTTQIVVEKIYRMDIRFQLISEMLKITNVAKQANNLQNMNLSTQNLNVGVIEVLNRKSWKFVPKVKQVYLKL